MSAFGRDWDRISDSSSGMSSLQRPYENSVWVSRAIKEISQPIASVPLRFEDEKTEQEIIDPKLEAFWKAPARRLTWFDTVEATVGWLNMAGEAFWLLGDEWNLPFLDAASLEPFIVAMPHRMEHVVIDGAIVMWKFTDKSGMTHNLLPEQVIHFKFWNPYDDYRGLAPYLAARIATEADYYAATTNRNVWQQAGDTGPYVINKTGMLTTIQQEQIKAALREKRAAAARGEFKTAFLTGDVTVEDPKVRSIDATALASRLQNRHEIAIAFGVPPSRFDIVASYSIGSASDRFILIEETCMPTGEKISGEITKLVKRMTRNENACAYFDWDEHSTMQAVRRERIDSAVKLFGMGQSVQSINEYLKMGMKPSKGWEIGYVSFSLAPVGESVDTGPEGATDDDYQEPDQEDESLAASGAAQITRAFRKRQDDASGFQSKRPKRELAQARHHEAIMNKIAKMFESKFNKVLMTARADTLRRLELASGGTKSIATRAAATDIVFDRHSFTRGLLTGMRQVAITALQQAGQTVMDELEIRDPWETPPAEVIAYNRIRDQKIVGVADNVRQSINKGEPISEMANRIKSKFNEISKGRAKTIARTEMGAAYGQGRQVAMEAAGVEWKEWLTSGRANVREAHVQANGQRVKVGEKFEVGGEELEGPGDPTGSPENVINCNCVAIAVASGPEDE